VSQARGVEGEGLRRQGWQSVHGRRSAL